MILSIDSSLSTFKRVEFQKGLNILLSDRDSKASNKQTRNSAGKTILIEIVHFLQGADCKPESIFRSEWLIEYFFQGEFSFWGERFSVERSGSKPSRIYIIDGLNDRIDLPIKTEKESGRRFFSNENWKDFLGYIQFDLPLDAKKTSFDSSYTPSFRSMFSYFVRRQTSGGFISPERQAEKQQRWDWQENLSYLFGLDWRISCEFQKVRAREKELKELKKAAKGGAIGNVIGTVAKLRSELTVAEKKVSERKKELQSFQVLESYNELSEKAAQLKREMLSLSRETIVWRETLAHLEDALKLETPPNPVDLEKMYKSAGIELPGVSLRRLVDVKTFYKSILENRKLHLQKEKNQLTEKIAVNESKISFLDGKRTEVFQILESQGALEDFIDLQRSLAELEGVAASLREKFKAAEILEGESTTLEIDRGNLHRRLQQDFKERTKRLNEIILLVTEIINDLYDDRKSDFEISATNNGPEFNISIEGDRNLGGIKSMEIFCLDFALFKLNLRNNRGPGFLIHDSHLFDGVDERQIAIALTLGAEASIDKGVQYIVTMNSDVFNKLPLPENILHQNIVLKTRISDKTDDGGLFGFRFG